VFPHYKTITENDTFVKHQPFVIAQMSEKKSIRVRNWPQVSTRIDPDTEKVFQKKLEEKGDSKADVIRRAIRDYNKK
jgi:hypothetical protein